MNDPHAEGPVCDFCGLAVDEGETLEPIFVGAPSKPRPHILQGTGRRGGPNRVRYRAKYEALRNALQESSDIRVEESNVIHEVEAIGGDVQFLTESELMDTPNPTDYRTSRTNKVGARIRIDPKDVNPSPDAEVCDTCAEMFKSLGDE